MPKAYVVRHTGSPDVLRLEEIPHTRPGPGQVSIRQTYIGVNYIDIYQRSGLYPMPQPFIPGIEGCGEIAEIGEGVNSFRIGDRVAYATATGGAYTEYRVIPARLLIAIPDDISDATAMATLAKGLTAHALLFRVIHIWEGCPILIHAAAGGMGQILCQWGKHLGANIFGTVSSPQKLEIAKKVGCQNAMLYSDKIQEKILQKNNGEGVSVVYDSVGKTTFNLSMECLKRFGLLVSFGQSSGPVPPINIMDLSEKGLFLTRPSLHLYKRERLELVLSAAEVFSLISKKIIRPNVHHIYSFGEAAKAHNDLASRVTSGSLLLKI